MLSFAFPGGSFENHVDERVSMVDNTIKTFFRYNYNVQRMSYTFQMNNQIYKVN